MPKRYPPEFRRAACARLVAGEKVIALWKSGSSDFSGEPRFRRSL